MHRYFIILFTFPLSQSIKGQNSYAGIVQDVGNRKALANAYIQGTNSGITTISDNKGYYKINLISGQKDTSNLHFFIIDNTCYFDLEKDATISIYSISGKVLLHKNLWNKGSIKIPSFPIGYYILAITFQQRKLIFFLFSDGKNILKVRKKNTTEAIFQSDSCLVFSKENYFDRKISLKDTDKIKNVNLLKKKYDTLDYFNELIRPEAFVMLHSSPPISNYGEVSSIKALYELNQEKMYYVNSKIYSSHYDFSKIFLNFKGTPNDFYHTQYGASPNKYLNLVTINYYKNIDKYVFEFGSYDQVDCDGIAKTYEKLLETSFFKDKLYFYPNNLKWEGCLDIPKISSEEIFFGQNYQALNLSDGYGFLKKVDIKNLANTYLGKHDIVLLNDVPNDLSVVSGIITTEFQTTLSHINILSHNRKTPNMALKDGWDNPKLQNLIGELVYLKVESDSFTIRKAGIDEATKFWEKKEPHTPIFLEKNTQTSGLIELSTQNVASVKTIGGKAANFAELVNMGGIPVPENYFAIPFYYYQQHIEKYGIDTVINNLLKDEKIKIDLEYRKNELKKIRDLIKDAPLDIVLIAMVKNRIKNFGEFSSFRFRSSTNAEDLESFSGAGLYDSYSAKKGHSKKTIERAIKKVWASLWNLRAFDERDYYKIDHNSTAMGILVHRSFPDEDANGVIITKNIYNVNHGYIFNVQYKEYSIVYPEPGILHDQIIVYTISLDNKDYTIEYLSHSNIEELQGKTVLTNDEIYELADYCTAIKRHYYYDLENNCDCSYNDFAMDLELKVDSQVKNRKIYIKQARIYSGE